MSDYEIRRYDTSGNLLDIISDKRFEKLIHVRTENTVGGMELLIPILDYQPGDFTNNNVFEIWRENNGVVSLQNETAYLLKDWEFFSEDGKKGVWLLAFDANWLLKTRIVAYDAASAQAEMTNEADDIMFHVVTDALGGDAAAARQLSELTIAGLQGDSQSLSKAFSRRNVLKVCQELVQAATEAGTRTYFDVVRTGICEFTFRTYTGQRGQDHGASSGDIRLVGEQYGNLENARYGEYHSKEINYIYAGGQGEEDDREIVEVSDADRMADGYPFNRCEGFIDARHCDTTALVTAEGNAGLSAGKPKQILTGNLVDTKGMQYNTHYGFGDILSVEAFGFKVDCHVSSVKMVVDSNGEKLTAKLKGEL